MVGRFEDYRDPGHFVGKGWMELAFDRMVIPPDTIIPVEARVVAVPGYVVDRYGRILGKGHTTRDIVEWSIPILWPLDLINLPRRGPRPTLREETRLTLKVMDDFSVPQPEPPQEVSPGLQKRPSEYQPSDYDQTPPPPQDQSDEQSYSQPQYQPQPQPAYQPQPQPVYQPQPQYQPAPQPVVQIYVQQPAYQPQPVIQTYVQPWYVPAPIIYAPPRPMYYGPPLVARAAIPYWGSYYWSRY
jgi:hypothetical protein